MSPNHVEATSFYGCPNPRCRATYWPVEAGQECPLNCGAYGVYAGVAVKEQDLTAEQEAERTVVPITEYEHAPPDPQPEGES